MSASFVNESSFRGLVLLADTTNGSRSGAERRPMARMPRTSPRIGQSRQRATVFARVSVSSTRLAVVWADYAPRDGLASPESGTASAAEPQAQGTLVEPRPSTDKKRDQNDDRDGHAEEQK